MPGMCCSRGTSFSTPSVVKMPLGPYLVHRPFLESPLGLPSQNFRSEISEGLHHSYPLTSLHPWSEPKHAGGSPAHVDKSAFQVDIDVQEFKPSEISVKIVDNFVEVEGKHEEKKDEHGFVSRHFVRRYRLPEDVETATVTSRLSSDGVLSVQAPRVLATSSGKERIIPITRAGSATVQ